MKNFGSMVGRERANVKVGFENRYFTRIVRELNLQKITVKRNNVSNRLLKLIVCEGVINYIFPLHKSLGQGTTLMNALLKSSEFTFITFNNRDS